MEHRDIIENRLNRPEAKTAVFFSEAGLEIEIIVQRFLLFIDTDSVYYF